MLTPTQKRMLLKLLLGLATVLTQNQKRKLLGLATVLTQNQKRKLLGLYSYSANPEPKKIASRASYRANPEPKKKASRASYNANPQPKEKAAWVSYKGNRQQNLIRFKVNYCRENQSQRIKPFKKYYAKHRNSVPINHLPGVYSGIGEDISGSFLNVVVLEHSGHCSTRSAMSFDTPGHHTEFILRRHLTILWCPSCTCSFVNGKLVL